MDTLNGVADLGYPDRFRKVLRLLVQPIPVALLIAAVFGAGFAWVRDSLAAGVPDSQAVPFAGYPGFVIGYSSGLRSLGNHSTLLLLLGVSAGMVLVGGLLVSYFASSTTDVMWGMAALCVLVVVSDFQQVYPMRGSEGTVRSVVAVKAGVLSWDIERVLISVLLLSVGIIVGLGVRCASSCHLRGDTSIRQSHAKSRFLGLFLILGTFLLCRASFVILRDVMGLKEVCSCFTLYPPRALANDGSAILALVASAGMLSVGFVCGLLARRRQKNGLAWLAVSMPSLVIIDATLSKEWRLNTLGGDLPVLGMLLAIGLIGLGSAVGSLAAGVVGDDAARE